MSSYIYLAPSIGVSFAGRSLTGIAVSNYYVDSSPDLFVILAIVLRRKKTGVALMPSIDSITGTG